MEDGERLDSWENFLTGLGTIRDKLTAQKAVLRGQLSDQTLEALHTSDDIAATIVEKLPSDALRASFTVTVPATSAADPAGVSKALRDALTLLGADDALQSAWLWARLYGFGAVLLGVDDGLESSEPIDMRRVRSLTHLQVFRRTELQPYRYYDDPQKPKYGHVEIYEVTQTTLAYPTVANATSPTRPSARYLVHESRLLKFCGVQTSRWGAMSAQYWDDSVLQRCHDVLREFSSSWMSAAHLMTDASQAVIKIANFMTLVTSVGEEKMRQRFRWLDLGRSVARAILLDERESFERVATSFQGIPELLDRFMSRVAAAAHMPQTVLFGRSPAGLNATGESDMRTWYDQVATERSKRLTPNIEQLVRVQMAAKDGPTKGVVLEGVTVDYPPLWQPTQKEKSEALKLEADALGALVTQKVMLPEEAALRLARQFDINEINVEAREALLKYALERMREPPEEPEPEGIVPEPDDLDEPEEPDEPDEAGEAAA